MEGLMNLDDQIVDNEVWQQLSMDSIGECSNCSMLSLEEEVAAHVEATFDRGQELLEKVRVELGPLAGELLPLKNGGALSHRK